MNQQKRTAQLISEMRKLLPDATPQQREQIIEMMTRCIQKLQPQKIDQQSPTDYLDER